LEHVKQANNNLKAAKTPLLEGLVDPRMRMAIDISLGLGCDTFTGGINNIGPSKILNIINNKNPASVTEFLRIVEGKQQTFGTECLHPFIDAWYYEPAEMAHDGEPVYIFDRPKNIDRYLQEFAHSTTNVNCGIVLEKCDGHACQP
jgi:hypothetical protein